MVVETQASHNEAYDGSNSMKYAEEDALNELTAQLSKFNWKDGIVDRAKHLLYSDDINDNIKGVLNLKAMLCIGREEVYEVAQEVIDSGVMNRLVQFLSVNQRDLQCPAAFCLTNIAAGHDAQTQIVVKAGAIPPLISFLRHQDGQLRRQAIFCLANVAGSTQEYRKMLATNPDYFSSLFYAGDISSDTRVLELVCWNLRNVCLLGGPTFEEAKPGLEYLLNSILKRYLHFQYWSGCTRYALETITAACRTEEGREFMLEQNLMQCVVSFLEHMSTTACTISQSAFEVCAWLLAYGTAHQKQIFVGAYPRLIPAMTEALQGSLGQPVEELALKCLLYIAADSDKTFLLAILEAQRHLIALMAQPFTQDQLPTQGIHSVSNLQRREREGFLTTNSPLQFKVCAGYIFMRCLVLTWNIPQLHAELCFSAEFIRVIFRIFDFVIEILKYKQCGDEASIFLNGETQPLGPPLIPNLIESLVTASLVAITEHIAYGENYLHANELLQNPVLVMYMENDLSHRLRLLNSMPLQEEEFNLCNRLLQQLFQY